MCLTSADARAVLKDRAVLAAAALVLAVLAGAGWLLFGELLTGDGKTPRYTHLHCPACRDEIPYSRAQEGKPCPSCKGGTYTPTVGSVLEGGTGGVSAGPRLLVFLLLAAVLVQGLAYLAALRFRQLRRAAEEARNRLLVCHCPYCKRKLGYPAAKAGTGAVCSRCKTAFTLPAAEGSPGKAPAAAPA